MIALNQKIKLPWSTRFYGLAWLFILLLGITFVFSLGGAGAEAFNYGGRFMIFIAVWLLLDYASVSYIVSEKIITINSGILIKKSKSIPFDGVQNINNGRGLVAMIFGVSKINIWTASVGQIHITNGNSQNKPAGSLLIGRDDAEWLKDYILKNK